MKNGYQLVEESHRMRILRRRSEVLVMVFNVPENRRKLETSRNSMKPLEIIEISFKLPDHLERTLFLNSHIRILHLK